MNFKEWLNEDNLKDYKDIKNIESVNYYPDYDNNSGSVIVSFLGADESYIKGILRKLESIVKKNYKVHWYVDDPSEWGMMKNSKGLHIDVMFRVTKIN